MMMKIMKISELRGSRFPRSTKLSLGRSPSITIFSSGYVTIRVTTQPLRPISQPLNIMGLQALHGQCRQTAQNPDRLFAEYKRSPTSDTAAEASIESSDITGFGEGQRP